MKAASSTLALRINNIERRPMKPQAMLKFAMGPGLMMLMLAVTVQAQPAAAQANGSPSEQDIQRNYSLYFEDFRNGNYERAMPFLNWILKHAPAFPRDDDRNFRRAIEGYEALAGKAEDPAIRRAYLDSALVVMDAAVPTLQKVGAEVDEFVWTVERGRFIHTHAEHFPDRTGEIVDYYRKAYEMAPEKLDVFYVQFIIADYLRKEDRDGVLEFMAEAEQKFSDSEELSDYIMQVRDSLFRNPADRIEWLESRLADAPDDMELINELFRLYEREKDREGMRRLGNRILQMEPSARTFQLLARMYLEDGETARAIELFERAIAMGNGLERREVRDLHYNMGVALQEQNRLQQARASFRRALEIDPSFGQALINIGDLYVTQISACGSFERRDRAVYWLAVDMYERAAAVDASIASGARQRAAQYRRFFPTAEDIFYEASWTEGATIRINYGCYAWINETTTIRR
jgi:tetratricopeptide (TPR) repeat protein